MGLFKSKQSAQPSDDTTATADEVFSEQYREELRQVGREHLKQLIETGSDGLRDDIDSAMRQVAADVKEYMARQLDVTIGAVNSEITAQLNERVSDYGRLAAEAQDLAAQSLTRNSQAVYEKYQQFSSTLQQTIASQEVQMITVFQETKQRAAAAQSEQDQALATLREMIEQSRQQADQMYRDMKQAIADHAVQLSKAQQDNLTQVGEARRAQDEVIESLRSSSQALQQQHQQMAAFLEKSVADHKAMMVEAINDNMARILEYYLIGALGEQSDIRAQLPSIVEQLEKNKQAMVDDMKL